MGAAFAVANERRCMSRFVSIATVGDIPPGEARAYVVGDREIALFNVDGAFYAIENACPHQGGPLAEGFIDGPIVTCPWHAWCFDVRDGQMTLGGMTAVEAYDVAIEGSAISVSSKPRT
jgi:nitrite reductase/ring-hydroxylating ferredoxin subunit